LPEERNHWRSASLESRVPSSIGNRKELKMAVLSLQYNGRELRSFPIGMGDSFVIGRHPVNDIVIDNLAVSFQHAKIESIGDDFLLIDLKSDNGSFVNDQPIRAHWLIDGDVITIGKHTLLFSNPKSHTSSDRFSESIIKTMQIDTEKFRALLKQNRAEATSATGTPLAAPANQRRGLKGILTVLSGEKKELLLELAPVRIGKAPDADIVVRGFGVGSTAAVINRLEDGWYLSYVGGLARVRVNGAAVKTSVRLNRLDVIQLRKTRIQFLLLAGE
jgi:pSer/pThr/pTyr-binding forkhead associated (FHA) protein